MDTGEWLAFASIPVFTGVIGWLINWSGLIMLFNPVHFHGRRIPGLRELSTLLPHKLQEVPGIMQGGIGWQGIVPARAAKMGSILVDKAIAKLGTPAEFYEELGPESIAEQIVKLFGPELPEIIDRIMRDKEPELWANLPPQAREAVVNRVRAQLPDIAHQMTTEIGLYVDQLLDPKILVIDHFTRRPDLVVRIFRDFGQRELNLMVNFGFIFGFLLGIPVAVLDVTFHQWWLLPILGVIVGWTTNLLGMQLIFEPVEPKKIGPFKLHGLFLRRQNEAAEVYAQIIADDVITLENGRRLPPQRPARRPHEADDRGRDGPDHRPRARPCACRRAGRRRHARVRHDHDRVRPGGGRADDDPLPRPRVLPGAEREHPRDGRPAHQGAAAGRLRRDDALGDQGGRVDALRARGDDGAGRRVPPPRDLRGERRMTDEPERRPEDDQGLAGLARLGATAAWRTAGWGVRTYLRAGQRIAEVLVAPEKAGGLASDVADVIPDSVRPGRRQDSKSSPTDDTAEWELLRARGAELMANSRDVRYVEEAHPAYEAILDEVAPDEGRILRLLLLGGPQPAIDIRTGGPLALLSSHLIAQGQTMIGARAGCRYVDRVPAYLNNLNRLGLIWFSRDTLHDPVVYQVLEAQPEALEAAKSVRMAKIVRRSIHLTPFGEDFCRVCLAFDETALDDLPQHSDPPED